MSQSSELESSQSLPESSRLREVRFEYTPNFPGILERLGVSLLVSTYQAGKLTVISSRGGELDFAFYHFDQAMGVAVRPRQIAVGTRSQVWFLKSQPQLAPHVQPAGTYDACYLVRTSFVTGNIHCHEMAWSGDQLWIVNTLFSCLATLHDEYSFVPCWRPPFIKELAAEDRCHLNGLAMHEGRPKYVTAMAESNEPAGWRPTKATSGVVIDVDSGATVARGFSMPHSPRCYRDHLWLLDSGKGLLVTVDPNSGKSETVDSVPGYTRGLAFCGKFAFVGLSRIRETAIFGGVPIADMRDELKCGVGVVDLDSGCAVAALQFHSGVEEIFDVQVLTGIRSPVLSGPLPEDDNAQSIWVVPSDDQLPVLAHQAESSTGMDELEHARQSSQMESADAEVRNEREPICHDGDPDVLASKALYLHEQGQIAEAVEYYQRALAINPHSAHVLNNLGNALQDLEQRDEAIACYRQAIEVEPRYVNAHRNLGYMLKEGGKLQDGLAALEAAQQIEPNDVIRVVMATALPPIYDSVEDLRTRREQLVRNVQQVVDDGVTIDVTHRPASTMFYGAYQGFNDRDLQHNLGRIYRVPDMQLSSKPRNSGGRYRIGLVSRYFRNHTIGRLNLGLVRELPRDLFEVTVISVGRYDEALSLSFRRNADHFIELPLNIAELRERVAGLGLDLLLFTDVGMDTLTYTLAFSRLAPVQCATWGHPVTTGSPAIDYFISSELLEVKEADEHYTESLVRFPNMTVYYDRPNQPPMRDRDYFGFTAQDHIYLCFQNLFKIHPEFDFLLREILDRDPRGLLVMMEGRLPHWTDILQRRFRRTLGSLANRVRFLPSQSFPDFMSLNAVADVSLDPIHFGGGNTTFEALSIGLPVVTWPSQFLRGRISQALYQQMQMLDCVADSAEQYVDIAVRLGTDKAFRQSIRERIQQSNDTLFADRRVIDNYTAFFESVIDSK